MELNPFRVRGLETTGVLPKIELLSDTAPSHQLEGSKLVADGESAEAGLKPTDANPKLREESKY